MKTDKINFPLVYSSHRQIMDAAGYVVLEVWSGGVGIEAADQLQDLVVVACNAHNQLANALRDIAQNARRAAAGDALAWAEELADIERDALAALVAAGVQP
jgi:hypothetical protein